VVRGCFLLCLWLRRKILTVTKGDIHGKSGRYHCQFGQVVFHGRNHAAVRKRVFLQYLSNSSSSQGGTKAVKLHLKTKSHKLIFKKKGSCIMRRRENRERKSRHF